MSRRQEFTAKTMRAAHDRSGGRCECGCGQPLQTGRIEYDHRIPCELGGDNSLSNCVVLRSECHRVKTRIDIGRIAKARRVRTKHIGAKRSSRPMPGGRNSPLKKRMDGTVVDRRTGEPTR